MSAPDILDEIKSDLGVATGDTTSDEWLNRRIAGIWARMEAYTSRALCAPPQKFVDDWGNIVTTHRYYMEPPMLHYAPRGSVFLRCFPVVSIDDVTMHGNAGDANVVRFDQRTGKLFTLIENSWVHDLSQTLRQSQARITYTAGWADIPADLYEVVLGAIQPLWATKKAGGAGAGLMGAISDITVADVGQVKLSEANLFVSSAAKAGGGTADPLLGPYVNMLDLYIDHRVRIGNEGQPTTEPVAAPAPPP